MQRWYFILLCLLILTLSGCKADDLEQARNTPEACRHAAVTALDRGSWSEAIELLAADRDCATAFSSEERGLNLAAAYAGKAGFDLPRVIDILSDRSATPVKTGKRLITLIARMQPGWQSLTDLERARLHYAGMMDAFAGGIHEACKEENRHLLSELQQDACFYHGAVALVRAASSFALILPDDLEWWLSGEPLACAQDRNDNGVLDSVETVACSLRAGRDPQRADGTCLPEINGHGAVSWRRASEHQPLAFYADGQLRAQLIPIEVSVAASGQCAGEPPRLDYPLLQPEGERASPALTSAFCSSVDMARGASGADPAAGSWPCPVLSAEGSGAATLGRSLLRSLNDDAETLYALLPTATRDRIGDTLESFRAEICEAVDDATDACEIGADGRLRIDEAALEAYLRQRVEAL